MNALTLIRLAKNACDTAYETAQKPGQSSVALALVNTAQQNLADAAKQLQADHLATAKKNDEIPT